MKIIILIIGIILSGIFGRMGGSDKHGTLWRDIGVPLCVVICCGVFFGWHWTLIISFGLLWGSMSTYFKRKGQPVRWWNFLIMGFAFNLALLPYIWAQGLWFGFGLRSLILPLAVMGWCVLIGDAVLEEFGRYALIVITLPLLFLGKKKDDLKGR